MTIISREINVLTLVKNIDIAHRRKPTTSARQEGNPARLETQVT
jgi:hypothetical protein